MNSMQRFIKFLYVSLVGYPLNDSRPQRVRPSRRSANTASRSLAVLCGVIATLYLVYRVGAVTLPAVAVVGTELFPKHANDLVCSSKSDEEGGTGQVVASQAYQRQIETAKRLSGQLLRNVTFKETDPVSGLPAGYGHSVDASTVSYEVPADSDGSRFLRMTSTVQKSGNVRPAWVIDEVPVASGQTYSYSFWYRSTAAVSVSLETTRGGTTTYKNAAELPVAASWQQFAGHFTNFESADAFRFTLTSDDAGQIDMKEPSVTAIQSAQLEKGIVSLTFDDGWQSAYDKAGELLKQYQMPATYYIISDIAKYGESGYMTSDELRELQRRGDEIGSHSLRHCDLATLSMAAMTHDLKESKASLQGQNLGPITSFAYPLGSYTASVQKVAANTYQYVRSSDAGYNDRYFDPADIRSMSVDGQTSPSDLQAWLDYAKEHKVWLVLVYHRFDESGTYNISSAQFERHLQMIKASGLSVMTLSRAALLAR